MKRLMLVIGVGLILVVLSFLGWFFLEYKDIRQGMQKLVSLDDYQADNSSFNINENEKVELGAIKAVYLGKKKNLKFLTLDSQLNPVVFKVDSGELDEEGKIKMIVKADKEDSYAIAEFNGNELMSKIKKDDLMELYVIKNQATQEFLNIMQARDENELDIVGLIKGFFGYRNLGLSVFMVNLL